jgi:chromosome segregation ATPase
MSNKQRLINVLLGNVERCERFIALQREDIEGLAAQLRDELKGQSDRAFRLKQEQGRVMHRDGVIAELREEVRELETELARENQERKRAQAGMDKLMAADDLGVNVTDTEEFYNQDVYDDRGEE